MARQWLGFPEPDEELVKAIPRISPNQLAERLADVSKQAGVALVDVRRADLTVSIALFPQTTRSMPKTLMTLRHDQGSMLSDSINLPAHTFYPARQRISDLLKDKETVVLYCASSKGRGPRCAGWLQETLQGSDSKARIMVLEGGAKAFVDAFGHNEKLVSQLPDEVKE